MTLDDARSLGEFLTFVALGGYASWKARKAARQTVATGNGFAKSVTDALVRIENKIDSHLQSHADAEVHREKKK